MLRLILAAILVLEINQIYAEPTEAPETTDQGLAVKRRWPLDDHLLKPVCWTEWFDRDDPTGSGDHETFKDLLKENPGKICYHPSSIEVQTLSGQKAPAPGDEIITIWPTIGLICKNKDQKDGKCEDYRVRFRCSAPYCADTWKTGLQPIGEVCWSEWFDRGDPSEKGDSELLKDLRNENPGRICAKPLAMEVVTAGYPSIAAINTGQNFYINNPHKGFVCRNMDQQFEDCYDYKVRFACPCR